MFRLEDITMIVSERLLLGAFSYPVNFLYKRDNGVAQPLEIICDRIEEAHNTRPPDSEVLNAIEEMVREGSIKTHPNGEGVTLYELTPYGYKRKSEVESYLKDVITFQRLDRREPGTTYGIWWKVTLSNGIMWTHVGQYYIDHIDKEGLRIPSGLTLSQKAHDEIVRYIVETFTLEGRAS